MSTSDPESGPSAVLATAWRPRSRVRSAAAPAVQSYLFAHTPSAVVYDCPGH
ncbi:hypothetical protein Misp01_01700 [Microtetraspora sp. NBRC 13810]|uniref:hypothetical protein n=1 Tax=Microtetraspora sp. NBRC 13810 TaxID=3030990 RepID=UPI0024A1727A|nr:hypothetical protein [Microtetraspora sp. NBRC 13810]GLW05040.1 hypothetical protein Misp01_01700 [Microtetraspora sp. NBRC 13810]